MTRKKLEASGSREDHQRAERDGEVDERNDAYRRAEAEVETAPHDGNGQDQDGEQDEERLLLAQFLVVPGIGADPSKQRRPAWRSGRPSVGVGSETRPSSPRSRAAANTELEHLVLPLVVAEVPRIGVLDLPTRSEQPVVHFKGPKAKAALMAGETNSLMTSS